jgi:glutamine phosphoribosylpyrophosphate amidotransferase
MRFQTENDTELIAVYLAYRMSKGVSLEAALNSSLEDLDGTFSYLVATRDAIGYAKDKLAAKPMVKYENDDLIAISSEEVGLNRLFPGQALETSEPAPLTCGLWSRN